MLGSDLAEQIQRRTTERRLGQLMESLAPQIEQDRQTLIELMQQLDSSKNPVKQATAWIAEKASRAKFSGMTSGDPELGTFMALETLTLGVRGKAACGSRAEGELADQHPASRVTSNLDELIRPRPHPRRRAGTIERRSAEGTKLLRR